MCHVGPRHRRTPWGYSTTYIGHLDITPPLNAAEVEWLTALAEWQGGPQGDVFTVPMNPRAVWSLAMAKAGGSIASSAPEGMPRGTTDWRPCLDGCRLEWDRIEKSNDAIPSIRFLVDHFLGPQALARDAGGDDFAAFSFDHALDGVIAAYRDDTEELFLIRAEDSRLSQETVVAGSDPCAGLGW
ncbi:hypothetical protein [Lapillicoccus sp.]|uniref:hypothetical protein n=1 Tax=Lapillicoccus sp. TaxID=1909287 RepID=UPI0025DC7013|nr:hypothetical protein [Lapillicoccus sp.]